ncbi:MAG: hypothetical protein U0325_05110 [Polyangiales bacterium]
MNQRLHFIFSFGCVLAGLAAGCGSSTPANSRTDAGRRRPVTAPPAVRSTRGPTAPMGAMSTGMMSRPRVSPASTVTVPVMNTEVYQFSCTPEGATAPTTCSWAYDAATMRNYIWWTQPFACESTGANADAAVLLEINADGSGGFLLGSACGDINLAGCQYDAAGTLTTCGACSLNESGLVVCVE